MAERLLSFCFICILFIPAYGQRSVTLKGFVQDIQTKEALSFATVQLMNGHSLQYGAITNRNGQFEIKDIKPGAYTLATSFLGYHKDERSVVLETSTLLNIPLSGQSATLQEVVVNASEGKGVTSTSKINRQAMEHLQPGCFTDLLELLPGGKSVDPAMNKANLISIREVKIGGSNGYTTPSEVISSLGIAFLMDGIPMNADANLQQVSSIDNTDQARNYVSRGIDMRTISTDNIESVEIVRGIPSVEYGELTGGMVKIKRKQKKSPFEARFKADEYGKLFAIGKGLTWGKEQRYILNTDLSYMDAKEDPRNSLENYKRLTGSLRLSTTKHGEKFDYHWGSNIDYSGSFDSKKYDPDILKQKDDSYQSTYNRIATGVSWRVNTNSDGFFRSAEIRAALTQEFSRIKQVKQVALDRVTALLNTTEEGAHDVEFLPYEYLAHLVVDGKPLNSFVKFNSKFGFNLWNSTHSLLLGGDWRAQKNWGNGQIYDRTRPLYPTSNMRPRAYKEIPADNKLSFFLEDNLRASFGEHQLSLTAGIRSLQLLGLTDRHTMQGKVYIDPRMNTQWRFPLIGNGKKKWEFDISGGIGLTTKSPTLSMLYPDMTYEDITQLNYYHDNPEFRRMNMNTYKWDNTNYALKPAKNRKWEVKAGASYGQNNFSVTYFREQMKDGFRSDSYWKQLIYTKYDAQSTNPSLQQKPELSYFTSTPDTLLRTYSQWANGSQIDKEGIEFQFSSERIEAIATRITVSGAWFKTTYKNSGAQYKRPQTPIINGKELKYVGLYNWEDGTEKQQFNTNFMFDTYLRKLGLIFSTSAQCSWFTKSRSLWNDGTPISYINSKGEQLPFREVTDVQLKYLVQTYSEGYFDTNRVPFAMDINFKATKQFGKYIRLAVFVNKLFTVYPDYTRGNNVIKRSSSPYFGMEANLKF